jgi:hypothetical protein
MAAHETACTSPNKSLGLVSLVSVNDSSDIIDLHRSSNPGAVMSNIMYDMRKAADKTWSQIARNIICDMSLSYSIRLALLIIWALIERLILT